MKDQIKILDCTLRDGGYYNNWNFSSELTSSYFQSIKDSGVSCLEVGTRNFPQDRFLGAFAYSADEYLRSLPLPAEMDIAVMVDAKTLLSRDTSIKESVRALFSRKSESPVNIVRIAIHFSEVLSTREIAQEISQLGYKVIVNLMQSGGKPDESLRNAAAEIASWKTVDVLYFADSLGNMDSAEVTRIISALREEWKSDLGIHTHNNQGQAIANSLTAMDLGVKWIDATILGMGRGAGNGATETLLLELEKRGHKGIKSERLYPLVLKYFEPLQTHYQWGPSLLYYLAAANNIHPTYIQMILSDTRYSCEEILDAVKFMSKRDTASFSQRILIEAGTGDDGSIEGTWHAKGWCANKEVLIIGAGESVSEHRVAIEKYVKDRSDIITISLNMNHHVNGDIVDLYVASDRSRIMLEAPQYKQHRKPIALPMNRIGTEISNGLAGVEVRDYGLRVNNEGVVLEDTWCQLPSSLAAGYALAIALTGQCACINLVGFDGYSTSDYRQKEMCDLFEFFFHAFPAVKLRSLTPTSYPVTQGSIYEPRISK
jgi:4-hydroxy 2-oxovalerate aldolase